MVFWVKRTLSQILSLSCHVLFWHSLPSLAVLSRQGSCHLEGGRAKEH